MNHCARLISLIITILISIVPAFAQSADPPPYVVGDTWRYTDGREVRVVSVEGGAAVLAGVYKECPECLYHVDQNRNPIQVTEPDGKPVHFAKLGALFAGPGWRYYEWPLERGKTWRFSTQGYTRGELQNVTVDCSVVAYEDVKTKAGVFNAYRIERSWAMNWSGFSGIKFSDTVWYAPDVKALVKFKPGGGSRRPEWELASYSLK